MKRTPYVCDRCGADLETPYHMSFWSTVGELNIKGTAEKDLCEGCAREVAEYAAAKIRPLAPREICKTPQIMLYGGAVADCSLQSAGAQEEKTLKKAKKTAQGAVKAQTIRKEIDIEKAVKLRRNGVELEKIAEEFDVSTATVRDRIARYEKATGERVYPGGTEIVDMGKVNALRKSGWTQRKIAEEFGVHESVISKHIKKWEAKNGPLDMTPPKEKPLEKWCRGEGDGMLTQGSPGFAAAVVPADCVV